MLSGREKIWPPELKGVLGIIRDSGGTFAYQVTNFLQGVLVLERIILIIIKYLDNFHSFIILSSL